MIRFLSLCCGFFILTACELPTLDSKNQSNRAFFDLKAFFDQEIAALEQDSFVLKKTVTHQGSSNLKTITPKSWEDELRIFKNCDINRPAWYDLYQVDSTMDANGLVRLRYQALEDKLSTRDLDIQWKDGQVHSISIVSHNNNAIYQAQQYLTYIPKEQYTVKKMQDVRLLDDAEFMIKANFTRL